MAPINAHNLQKTQALMAEERLASIATFFRDHRINAGLSVEQVALEIGLAEASILEQYENGTEPIPLDEIFSLTNVLNIPPEEVLTLIFETYGQGPK